MRYITTPIYYVNDAPHIGHAYTTIIADTLARLYRLQGKKTLFLTGTDEHGQKIEQAASSRNFTPKEYADKISKEFKELWDEFNISYDIYARTTDERHIKTVQAMFLRMFEKGDIYKGEYEGYYCVSCETFFTKTQLKENECCADCGKKTSIVKEESYFFRLSKYQDKILKWYEQQEPILPKNKTNELINFVKEGLKDLSITRTSFDWGIKIPKEIKDEKHIIYVWLDALFIYVSSIDYLDKKENSVFWPAYMHLVGKDILKFHAIFWPAFLMSASLELPRYVAAHGWWTRDGEKMSKSKGNVIKPKEVVDAYGLDPFRYFLLREVPFGNDGDFSETVFINRNNAELCNELGNLLNRISGMAAKYSQNVLKSDNVKDFFSKEILESKNFIDNALHFSKTVQFSKFLEELFKALAIANLSITKYEPWNLVKNGNLKKANALISLCANILAKVAMLLSAVMPDSMTRLSNSLNFKINNENYKKLIEKDELFDFEISVCDNLFKKIETPLLNSQKSEEKKDEDTKIKIDDFSKLKIKIATVLDCENIEGSEKLLKFKLDLGGNDIRQVLSGIAKFYNAKDLIGKQVCVLSNLKKAKIFGYESDGMILSVKSEDKLVLLSPNDLVLNGSLVG
ncbi:methionine--tRNA ligase [uncultured Campylobacter sp.]|uniref:methionine--tRNA ligase n=1 Tax=uncultured Campylobacter sp. TaxID=218934 RepID=UPI002621A9F6|nr:methionine--tRNA ligase [uncultured Campylobacter sp.]